MDIQTLEPEVDESTIEDLMRDLKESDEPPCQAPHTHVDYNKGRTKKECGGSVVARETTCANAQFNVCQRRIDQVRAAPGCACGYKCKQGESLYDGHWTIRNI